MTQQAPAREPLLELQDALAQHQLRDAGAEVAAAIAHAVGTPLNVISGRAELIRHDPSNALTQVARIEEQVKKLANGLRQLVDYLALPDPRAAQGGENAGAKRSSGDAAAPPRVRAAGGTGEAAAGGAPGLAVVDAKSILDDVVALTESLAQASHVEVVADGSGLDGARVERWHALGTLKSLLSSAIRHAAAQSEPARVRVSGKLASQGVVFELLVPGVALLEGWQLEHFQARPAATEISEFHRTMSICAAIVRGHGGKLLIESAPDANAIVVRFSCINES